MEGLFAPEFLIYSNRPQHLLPREIFDSFGIVLKKFLDAIYICAPAEYDRFLGIIMKSFCEGHLIARSDERHAIVHQMREALETDAGRLALSNIDRYRVRISEYEFEDHDEGLFECLGICETTRLQPREWLVNAFRHAFYLAKLFLTPAQARPAIKIYARCHLSDVWTAEALYEILGTLVRCAPGVRALWQDSRE